MIELDVDAVAEEFEPEDEDTIICGACGQDVMDCTCPDGPMIDAEGLMDEVDQ